MTYRWVEHTAELGLEIETPTPEQVFVEAMLALAELLDGGPGAPETREVRLDRADLPALLVTWLEELLFLAETGGFVAEHAEVELRGTGLQASVRGRVTEPRPLVKAVTYHGLELEPTGEGWHAKVVLDV